MTNPNYYIGTAADGSRWIISRGSVLADMITHEGDDPWPRPISEDCVMQWLCDNSDTISGWQFFDDRDPSSKGILDIEAAE